jgi:hypothetical protein
MRAARTPWPKRWSQHRKCPSAAEVARAGCVGPSPKPVLHNGKASKLSESVGKGDQINTTTVAAGWQALLPVHSGTGRRPRPHHLLSCQQPWHGWEGWDNR